MHFQLLASVSIHCIWPIFFPCYLIYFKNEKKNPKYSQFKFLKTNCEGPIKLFSIKFTKYIEKNFLQCHLVQRTTESWGMPRMGAIVFPGKSTPAHCLSNSNWSSLKTRTWNIIQTEQAVLKCLGTYIYAYTYRDMYVYNNEKRLWIF